MQEEYKVEEEIEKHIWADLTFLQSPVNGMGMTWSFKKYMDDVYTAGIFGQRYNRDARSAKNLKENYRSGATLTNT